MPIFNLIQAVIGRIAIGIIAIITAIGLGSISEPLSIVSTNEEPLKKAEEIVMPVEEIEEIIPEITPTDEEEVLIEPEIEEEPIDEIPEPPVNEEPVEETSISEDVPETTEEEVLISETELPLSFSQINTDTSEALVNIICFQKVLGSVSPITGSGVIIDPRGIVITNAHVAQFFLLEDYPSEDSLKCVLRTGSPARSKYTAELLFISPEWVSIHATEIRNSNPVGTGEHDYAFLRITGRTNANAELPDTFPFIPIDITSSSISTGDTVLAAAYPAGFLGGTTIQKYLYSVSSVATVGERFTFLENTVDLFSIGGTVVSQGGSSGGAVVSDKNELIGVIVTSTQAETTSERDLRAITLGHVNRALLENSNINIEGLLLGDVELKADLFNLGAAPSLTNLFIQYLTQ